MVQYHTSPGLFVTELMVLSIYEFCTVMAAKDFAMYIQLYIQLCANDVYK